MPYLRSYTWRNRARAAGRTADGNYRQRHCRWQPDVMTDTLAGNPVPFEHSSQRRTTARIVPGLTGSALSRSIPFYAPSSRRTLGIYCLIVIVCVGIKGLLSFTGPLDIDWCFAGH